MTAVYICFALVLGGYFSPRRIGWTFLLLAPLLGSMSHLIFLSDDGLPLRFNQAMFSVALGVALVPSNRSRLWSVLMTVRPIQLMVIFLAMEICYAFMDPNINSLKYILLHLYPLYFGTLLLAFSLVRGEVELEFVNKAVVFVCVLIGALALAELYWGYNLDHHLCAINFASCNIDQLNWAPASLSEGRYEIVPPIGINRYAGFTGDPNSTATVLAMCLIGFFYVYLLHRNEKIKQIILLGLMMLLTGILVLSQSRSAIAAFGIVSAFVVMPRRSLLRCAVFGSFVVILTVYFNSDLQKWVWHFVENRLTVDEIITSDQRSQSLVDSWTLLVDSFGIGVGGDVYSVGDNQLRANDASPYIIYYVVGGVVLGTINLMMLASFVFDLLKQKKLVVSRRHRLMISLFTFSIAIALLVNLFYAATLLFYITYFYACARSSVFQLRSG